MARKLLLVGWDAAEWNAATAQPATTALAERGVMGSPSPVYPLLPRFLWQSLVTGSTGPGNPPLWDLLSALQYSVHVVGWPGISPDVPDLAVTPDLLDASILRCFLAPDAVVPLFPDQTMTQLVAAICAVSTVHNQATWLLENRPWNFLFVLYPGTGAVRDPLALDAMYRLQDAFLARLLELTRNGGDDIAVMIVSPCANGFFLAVAPGIPQDQLIHRISILDVAPTALYILGHPIPASMEGSICHEMFPDAPVAGPPPGRLESGDAEGLCDQWLDWETRERSRGEPADTWYGSYPLLNRAVTLLTTGRPGEAAEILAGIHFQCPEELGVARLLIQALLGVGDADTARGVLAWLFKGHERRAWMDYFQGILEMHESGLPSAAPWFASARAAAPDAAFLPAYIGKALLHYKHWREAEEAFFACTTLDPGRADGWAGLAAVYLKLRRNADAEFCAARAVGCRFNHPFAHHQLGLARARQGHYAEAVASFETSQRLTPGRRHESRLLQILRIYAQMEAAPAQ
jgi:hypothetical protein